MSWCPHCERVTRQSLVFLFTGVVVSVCDQCDRTTGANRR